MAAYEADTDRGSGWVAFAGVMILLVGFLNLIYGIAAIDDSAFFTGEERFVLFSDLNTWGWIHTILGVVQIFAAFSIFNRRPFGAIIGVATAGFNLIAVLLWITASPVAGFMIALIDVLVIYGLIAHGVSPRPSSTSFRGPAGPGA
jgi:hypothetical protein